MFKHVNSGQQMELMEEKKDVKRERGGEIKSGPIQLLLPPCSGVPWSSIKDFYCIGFLRGTNLFFVFFPSLRFLKRKEGEKKKRNELIYRPES